MKKIFSFLCLITLLFSCRQNDNRLIIGIISPSLNHLPLDFGLQMGDLQKSEYIIKKFASGWETNEALVAGKIDVAILPFTYIWQDVAKQYDVKIISCLERESDGIIAKKEIDSIEKLDGRSVGVLRASTLDIFAAMLFAEHDISPEVIEFRTPTEMASALKYGDIDALSFYVPSIFRFNQQFSIIHWYGDSHPHHPCCDIAATGYALQNKKQQITAFLKGLQASVDKLNENPYTAFEAAETFFGISNEAAKNSIYHTKYIMGMEPNAKKFEMMAVQKMLEKGYIENIPAAEEIYFEVEF